MSKGRLRIADYLRHIRDAIERIDSYTNDCDEFKFSESNLISDAKSGDYPKSSQIDAS
jgi:uncharacterized protein with HEPN domain